MNKERKGLFWTLYHLATPEINEQTQDSEKTLKKCIARNKISNRRTEAK